MGLIRFCSENIYRSRVLVVFVVLAARADFLEKMPVATAAPRIAAPASIVGNVLVPVFTNSSG
jgi:hypothetical protein